MALRLQLDPSQLVSAASQAENAIERVGNEAVTTQTRLNRLETNTARAGTAAVASAGSMRMLTQQLSQVGQQTMATGNFVQALAIQLPDIGLAFGAVGTAAGLLAGIALPLVMQAFSGTAAEAKTFDVALNDVLDSLDQVNLMAKANSAEGLADLEARYGRLTAAVRSLIQAQTDLAQVQALNDMQAALSAISDTLGNGYFSDRLSAVAEIFGMEFQQGVGLSAEAQAANREVSKLALQIDNLSQIEGFSAQADAAAALRQQIVIAAGGVAQMSTAQREVYQQLVSAEDAARALARATGEVAPAVETASSAVIELANNTSAAAGMGSRLADQFARAANNAAAAAAAMASAQATASSAIDARMNGDAAAPEQTQIRNQLATYRASLSTVGTSGGGGGGGGSADLLEPAYWDDLIDSVQAGADAFQEVQDNAKAGAAALSDLFIAAADGADALKQSLSDLLAQLGQVALQNALTSLAGMGGTTGTLFAALGASLKPRASGGPVSAGTPYMVGENGPEPFIPAVDGRILSVPQAQAALAGGSGGSVNININLAGANGNAEIEAIATRAVAMGLETYDRGKFSNARMVNGDRRRIS